MVQADDMRGVLEHVMQKLAVAMDLPPFESLEQSRDSLHEVIINNEELRNFALSLIDDIAKEESVVAEVQALKEACYTLCSQIDFDDLEDVKV